MARPLLPGPGVDALIHRAVTEEFGTEVMSIDGLAGMHLTVLDGDFDRDTLRNNDLTLEPFALLPQDRRTLPWTPPPDIQLAMWVPPVQPER